MNPTLVTPFKSDLSIDFEALTSLANHCVDGNVDFLVALRQLVKV